MVHLPYLHLGELSVPVWYLFGWLNIFAVKAFILLYAWRKGVLRWL